VDPVRAIEENGEELLLALGRAAGVPGSWHVGPSMRPMDIGERLLAHGFSYGGDDIGMAGIYFVSTVEKAPATRHRRGPHPATAAGSAGDGLPGLPQAEFSGALRDRPLRAVTSDTYRTNRVTMPVTLSGVARKGRIRTRRSEVEERAH